MDALPRASMYADAFIAWSMEQPEGCRYELAAGEIVQMASGRARHAVVRGEAFALLRDAVRERNLPCQVFPDGMAVQIDAHTVYEPDAAVRFGPKLDDDVVKYSDPLIVVEVLSPTTQALNAGGKLAEYFRLPSLQHYLILDPKQKRVIHHQRHGADIRTWLLSSGEMRLDPPDFALDVAALFPE